MSFNYVDSNNVRFRYVLDNGLAIKICRDISDQVIKLGQTMLDIKISSAFITDYEDVKYMTKEESDSIEITAAKLKIVLNITIILIIISTFVLILEILY